MSGGGANGGVLLPGEHAQMVKLFVATKMQPGAASLVDSSARHPDFYRANVV
jgi:hypothetical protein